MKWDKMRGKVRFKTAEELIKTLLEINIFDFYDINNEKLLPYLTIIIEYLNKRLLLIGGTKASMIKRLQELDRIFKYGTNKILNDSVLDLVYEMEISVKEDVTPDYVPFNNDLFIFTWTNFLSSLCVRTKFIYNQLLTDYDKELEEMKHQPKFPKGDTVFEIESWRSDVFPDDELYDRTNWMKTNDAWGGHSWHSFLKNYRDIHSKE